MYKRCDFVNNQAEFITAIIKKSIILMTIGFLFIPFNASAIEEYNPIQPAATICPIQIYKESKTYKTTRITFYNKEEVFTLEETNDVN